ISQSGALDTGFSPQSGQNGTDRTVHALAVHQDKLYAGGEFTYYRGIRSNRLAKISSSGALESNFDCRDGMNGTVRALAIAENGAVLYAGGEFTRFRGQRANRIAKIKTSNSTLDQTFNPQNCHDQENGFDSTVYALAISQSGERVY